MVSSEDRISFEESGNPAGKPRVGPRAWLRSAAALLLASALAGCAAHARPATVPAEATRPPVVHDLRTLADLTELFDRDRDHPRIVLLLSPT